MGMRIIYSAATGILALALVGCAELGNRINEELHPPQHNADGTQRYYHSYRPYDDALWIAGVLDGNARYNHRWTWRQRRAAALGVSLLNRGRGCRGHESGPVSWKNMDAVERARRIEELSNDPAWSSKK